MSLPKIKKSPPPILDLSGTAATGTQPRNGWGTALSPIKPDSQYTPRTIEGLNFDTPLTTTVNSGEFDLPPLDGTKVPLEASPADFTQGFNGHVSGVPRGEVINAI